jgi:excisionase family DNA binding protein
MSKKLLTVREVVDLLSINKSTIYLMVERGEIPALRIRGSIRFRPEALDEWLATCEIPKPRGRKRTEYRSQPHTINTSIDAPSLH